ncbi:hypothetical protein lacNasYZ03_05160 [Lactobacillus nasalidis]|uniref:Competence protein ComGF n=1 Tax=Lactobacillus nasalidis TaxID=2797258 RepID=A0ABQ3W553_9LACO|nr:hypothetical protein lacNasYZ01_07270 [Lactobacillus nasalidis]GHW00212.1 hypothetical protein lacNasYZ02_16410 [Lactobacillus nasalidis]GHW00829.1 hypothetical protein lacNasYZ03_05160 [Lactobacillus nasalidis]
MALEALVALAIVCVALTTTVTCLSGIKELENQSSQRAGQALAYRMLKECPVKRVKVRDHEYVLTGKGDLYDETQQKICQK